MRFSSFGEIRNFYFEKVVNLTKNLKISPKTCESHGREKLDLSSKNRISDGAKQGGFIKSAKSPDFDRFAWENRKKKHYQNFRPPSAARWEQNKEGLF